MLIVPPQDAPDTLEWPAGAKPKECALHPCGPRGATHYIVIWTMALVVNIPVSPIADATRRIHHPNWQSNLWFMNSDGCLCWPPPGWTGQPHTEAFASLKISGRIDSDPRTMWGFGVIELLGKGAQQPGTIGEVSTLRNPATNRDPSPAVP